MQHLVRHKFILFILALVGIVSISVIAFNAATVENDIPIPTRAPEPTISVKSNPAPTSPPEQPISQLIVVKFKPGTSQTTISQIAAKYNASITKQISGINLTILSVAAGQEEIVVNQLTQEPSVERVRREYPTNIQMVPNDPDFRLQWGLLNGGNLTIDGIRSIAGADIEVEKAWDVSKGRGIKVAIIDTGIDAGHPDLVGKIAAQKGFGYADSKDNHGHGTHVAGIIAANANNSTGIAGVCPDCQLIVAKALDDNGRGIGTGRSQDSMEAMVWAADQGAKVINMSFGTQSTTVAQDYADAVNYATQKGAIVVAASGNNGTSTPFYPAGLNTVISVAATDNTDKKANFSNYGDWVKVSAPGFAIYSTVPTYQHARSIHEGTGLSYAYANGTSMASPVVSGVVALVWTSQYGTSPTSVINRIYATAEKIQGTGTYWVNGRVNATAAVGTATKPTIAAIPSIHCVGGSAQAPCATIPATKAPTVKPISTTKPTVANPAPTTIGNPNTTTNPCLISQVLGTATTPETTVYTVTNDQPTGNGFFKTILEFFIRFIEMIFRFMTGANPGIPGGPTPTAVPTPCPQPTVVPTIVPTATSIPTPTVAPTSTIALTPTTNPIIPTTSPCIDTQHQNNNAGKKDQNGSKDNNGFLAQLFEALMKLIAKLLELLLGKAPGNDPTTPQPTPTPCP